MKIIRNPNVSQEMFERSVLRTDFRNKRLLRQENRIRRSTQGIYEIPIELAVQTALISTEDKLNYWHKKAEKDGKSFMECYTDTMKTSLKARGLVESAKFIGGNGIGKSELIIPQICDYLIARGFNPIVHKYVVGQPPFARPSSQNPEKDVLIFLVNCVDLEGMEVKGMPLRDDKTRYKYHGFEKTEEMETVPSLTYAEVLNWADMKFFAQSIVLLDEINRTPELSLFNALLNGETVDGVNLSPYTMFMAMQNSEMDGLNMVHQSDLASKTKTRIYPVYQTVEDWLPYAVSTNHHTAVTAYAAFKPILFEHQLDNGKEIASPTFRGLSRTSNDLHKLEQYYAQLGRPVPSSVLRLLVQSNLGDSALLSKHSQNLAQDFETFYNTVHLGLLKHINDSFEVKTKEKNHFHFGLADRAVDKAVNKAVQQLEKAILNAMSETVDEDLMAKEATRAIEEDIKKMSPDVIARWVRILPSYVLNRIVQFFKVSTDGYIEMTVQNIIEKEKAKKQNISYDQAYRLMEENLEKWHEKYAEAALFPMLRSDMLEMIKESYLLDTITDFLARAICILKSTMQTNAEYELFCNSLKEVINFVDCLEPEKLAKILPKSSYSSNSPNGGKTVDKTMTYLMDFAGLKLRHLYVEDSKALNSSNEALRKAEQSKLIKYNHENVATGNALLEQQARLIEKYRQQGMSYEDAKNKAINEVYSLGNIEVKYDGLNTRSHFLALIYPTYEEYVKFKGDKPLDENGKVFNKEDFEQFCALMSIALRTKTAIETFNEVSRTNSAAKGTEW